MKTEVTKTSISFEPVYLKLTIESQQELDFWATLFNHSDIADSAKKFMANSDGMFEHAAIQLEAVGGDMHQTDKMNLHLRR